MKRRKESYGKSDAWGSKGAGGAGDSWSWSERESWNRSADLSTLHGVEMDMICDCVPMIGLDPQSVFNEHVSAMLQSSVDSYTKVDSLFEYCEDSDIIRACARLGHKSSELAVVKLKSHPGVRAVGTSGKRSLLLALTIALTLQSPEATARLFGMLREYNIVAQWAEVFGRCKEAKSSNSKGTAYVRNDADSKNQLTDIRGSEASLQDVPGAEGIQLSVVCDNVPVISLDKSSILNENVSWLLQTVTDSGSKVDSLYKYADDPAVSSICSKMGLTKQEICIVELAHISGLKAVGVSGKRSAMLACVIAVLLDDERRYETFKREMMAYDSRLLDPLEAIMKAAGGGSTYGRGSHGGSSHNGGRYSAPPREKAAPNIAWASVSAAASAAAADSKRDVKLQGAKLLQSREERTQYAQKEPAKAAMKGFEVTADESEIRARSERQRRFETAQATEDEANGGQKRARSIEEAPVAGSSTDLERPYFRLTSEPRASDVRPLPVLKQAFELLLDKWKNKRDWAYASEMLRSIQQDLTVQMIRDTLTIEVYEFAARTALEQQDFKLFEKCCAHLLDDYYGLTDASRTEDASPNVDEFIAYRGLYLALENDQMKMMSFLKQYSKRITRSLEQGNKYTVFASALRSALAENNVLRAVNLVESSDFGTTSAMGCLSLTLLESSRLTNVIAVCKAFKPTVPANVFLRLAPGEVEASAPSESADDPNAPLVYLDVDAPDRVNVEATLAEVDRRLALFTRGARRRLGQQRSEHIRGFVRDVP
eukprot:TRINITY_DN7388_c0_g1_i1.p1 TRINITY_DN7388_c0_g1~~TRINITY_DN7388_c0_g1_i1.p1  ORF type:complete len:768 (+),score=113.50 TRINITY_DN7388_c0_g1_i1:236-2539(+)